MAIRVWKKPYEYKGGECVRETYKGAEGQIFL
jgi:hypothetical protein